jgi:hypothetical protein
VSEDIVDEALAILRNAVTNVLVIARDNHSCARRMTGVGRARSALALSGSPLSSRLNLNSF